MSKKAITKRNGDDSGSPERKFRNLLKARNALLWITTTEERRVEVTVQNEAEAAGYAVFVWDCATGAVDGEGKKIELGKGNPILALYERIRERTRKELWVLRDLNPFFKDPFVERGLKSLARDLEECSDPALLATIVLISPSGEIPTSLRSSVTAIEWPLPKRDQIERILNEMVEAFGAGVECPDPDAVIDAAAGLTATDAESAIALSVVSDDSDGVKTIRPGVVLEQKRQIIEREKVVSWYDPDPRGLDAVGGLELLKSWLDERHMAFSEEARAFGLPAPKGVLIAGVPGCGKSLTAKCVPSAWGLPLLRLDMGGLRAKYVGESEANLRNALRVAEAVAPCVLWLDEIEKSLGGSGDRSDGGVSADALGTILTWLQDREGSVFVVATANQVEKLPPELARKGRFDEVFFVDLPTPAERAAILKTTLAKHGREPNGFDLDRIVDLSDEFSGAEVAELVPSGLFTAWKDGMGKRDLSNDDLVAAANATVPLARSRADDIKALRAWAQDKARPASLVEEARQSKRSRAAHGRVLDLD